MIDWFKHILSKADSKYRTYSPVVPLFVLAFASFAVYRLYQTPETYSSVARLVVSGKMNLPESSQGYIEELSNFLGTQVEIIGSQQIAKQAREQLALEHPELSGTAGAGARLLRGTSIIVVEAMGSNPTYTKAYLDEVLRQYMELRSDNRREVSIAAMKQIREEIDHIEPQIAAKEDELFKLKQRNNIGYWERQSADAGQLLSELRLRQANLKMQLQLFDSIKPQPGAQDDGLHVSSISALDVALKHGSAVPADSSSAQIAQLHEELVKLQVERDSLLATFKPKHPRIVKIDTEIAKLGKLIEVLSQESERSLARSASELRSELATVDQAVLEWEKKAVDASRTEAEYEKIQESLTRLRDLYTRLVNSLQNEDVSKDVTIDIVRIMEPASDSRPVKRSVEDATYKGAMLGLLCGAGALMGLVKLDNRAFSASEISRCTKTSAWIEIPEVGDAELEYDPLREPMPLRIKEAMRMLSAAIFTDNSETKRKRKVIFCASSTPGEGKSTVAQNLALHAAESGLTTLLIDADLRRGRIGTKFGLPPTAEGLAELIKQPDRNWMNVMFMFPEKKISLLPRGNLSETTLDSLVSWLGYGQLAKFKQAFDVVIIDSAPLVPVADSVRFLAEVDEVLLVTRLKATRTTFVERIAAIIRKFSGKEFKLIVNGVTDQGEAYDYS